MLYYMCVVNVSGECCVHINFINNRYITSRVLISSLGFFLVQQMSLKQELNPVAYLLRNVHFKRMVLTSSLLVQQVDLKAKLKLITLREVDTKLGMPTVNHSTS